MKRTITFLVACFVLTISSTAATADVVEFKLTGNGGDGLLESNIDPPTGEVGTGDLGALGIMFDTLTNNLRIHVEWGSDFGYTDLSEDAFKLHLHGPTPDSAPGSFGQTGPLLITLSNSTSFNSSRTGGGVNDIFFLDNSNVSDLMQGRLYVNVHLSDTDTGRIRGYIVQSVPEPSLCLPLLLLACGKLTQRKKTR